MLTIESLCKLISDESQETQPFFAFQSEYDGQWMMALKGGESFRINDNLSFNFRDHDPHPFTNAILSDKNVQSAAIMVQPNRLVTVIFSYCCGPAIVIRDVANDADSIIKAIDVECSK